VGEEKWAPMEVEVRLLNYKLDLALQFSVSFHSCVQRQRMQQQHPRRDGQLCRTASVLAFLLIFELLTTKHILILLQFTALSKGTLL
jgi:hypothetical protein